MAPFRGNTNPHKNCNACQNGIHLLPEAPDRRLAATTIPPAGFRKRVPTTQEASAAIVKTSGWAIPLETIASAARSCSARSPRLGTDLAGCRPSAPGLARSHIGLLCTDFVEIRRLGNGAGGESVSLNDVAVCNGAKINKCVAIDVLADGATRAVGHGELHNARVATGKLEPTRLALGVACQAPG